MRKTLLVVGVTLAVLTAVFFGIGAVSPSTEVVLLTSVDADGVGHETPLWVVEDEGHLWLRSGSPDSSWLARLRSDPELSLVRDEQLARYRAIPIDGSDASAARDRINVLMAEKYGASNSLVALFGDHSVSVAIRLEPDTAVGAGVEP